MIFLKELSMNDLNLPRKEELISSLKHNDVAFAALFGSRAKGLATPNSDYDFLVEFKSEKKYSLFDIVEVKDSLQKILHSDVDVITTGGLNTQLKNEVLSSLQVLYDERKR